MVRTSIILAFLGFASVAMAQDDGIASALQKATTASPQEMRDFSTESVATVKGNAKAVAVLLKESQSSSDVSAQNCITPKNISAQALVQVTELAAGNLERALGEGGDEGTAKARHEYRKIAVSLNKSESIRAEAQQCGDGEGQGSRSTRTDWEGGVGDDHDVVDDGTIDDLDFDVQAPVVSPVSP